MYKRFTKNPKHETNDCAIRSFANAENKDWQEVAKEVFDIALTECLMPNDIEVITQYATKHNYEEGYIFPDDPCSTVQGFAEKNNTGRYVILLDDHALSIIDGDYYDLVDSAQCQILSYWKVG